MKTRTRQAGFTLVELVITVFIIGILSGAVTQVLLGGSGAFRMGVTVADLEARTARTLERMSREIAAADADTMNPADPAGGNWVEFTTPTGTVGKTILWGPRLRYRVELAPLELNNGVDDNNNGLVDEGVLVRIEDFGGPNERRVVLARGVAEFLEGEIANGLDDNGNGLDDEGGLAISIQTGGTRDALTLRLTLQGVDAFGDVLERTLETTVALRN
ncbi:MAG: prepilin-type N-terminal cleavage/methylation domain-containing protein [Planctomycetota bacterium]